MEQVTKAGEALPEAASGRRQFLSYLGIGIIATLADWAIFYVLAGRLGVFYPLALAASYGSSTAFNFFANRRFTFRNRYSRVGVQLAVFSVIAVAGLGLNELVVYAIVRLVPGGATGISLMAARMTATAVVFVWNFVLNKSLTFRVFR